MACRMTGEPEEPEELPLVRQLLALDARGQKERWEGLSVQELEAEIDTYKAALQEVVDEFRRLGEAHTRHTAGKAAG